MSHGPAPETASPPATEDGPDLSGIGATGRTAALRLARTEIALLFALALAVRLGFAWFRRHAPLSLDSLDYLSCGRAILDGLPWPAPWRPPGWPIVVAWTLAIGGGTSPLPAIGLNILLSSALAPLSAALALRLLPRWPALIAGGVVALHPSLLFLTPAVLTEPLSWLLVTLLALRLTAPEGGGPRRVFVSGLVAGELWLVRAAALLLLPLPLLLPRPVSLPALGRRLLPAAAGLLAVILPSYLLVRTRTGLAGNAPGSAEHMFWMGAHPSRLVPEREIPPIRTEGRPGESDSARHLRAALADYSDLARTSPGAFVLFPFRKLWALHELTSSGGNRGVALLFQLPLSLLAIFGFFSLRRAGGGPAAAAGTIATIALLVALPPLITMPWTRYYSPLVPLLTPLAVAAFLPRNAATAPR